MRKYKNVFNIRAGKFNFPKYKKNFFLRTYKKFFKSGLFLFFSFFEVAQVAL